MIHLPADTEVLQRTTVRWNKDLNPHDKEIVEGLLTTLSKLMDHPAAYAAINTITIKFSPNA